MQATILCPRGRLHCSYHRSSVVPTSALEHAEPRRTPAGSILCDQWAREAGEDADGASQLSCPEGRAGRLPELRPTGVNGRPTLPQIVAEFGLPLNASQTAELRTLFAACALRVDEWAKSRHISERELRESVRECFGGWTARDVISCAKTLCIAYVDRMQTSRKRLLDAIPYADIPSISRAYHTHLRRTNCTFNCRKLLSTPRP